MKLARSLLAASTAFAALPANAQIPAFKHIVIVVQENRTPDNLFNAMCQQHGGPAQCDPNNVAGIYDIATDQWKDYANRRTPVPVDLSTTWDIRHGHNEDWVPMCDQQGSVCLMDGAAGETCHAKPGDTCPDHEEFMYVQRMNGTLDVLGPYITLAMTYGWANLMFQTNQGPSFPAHQFIYGGTSADSATDDSPIGRYAAENAGGCLSAKNVTMIDQGTETGKDRIPPCFDHFTLGRTISPSQPWSWRYYAPVTTEPALWTAPNALKQECVAGGSPPTCTGSEFTGSDPNVFPDPTQVLKDVANCQLRQVSWVIPKGQYSDHAGIDSDYGPAWVASVVNAIGGNPACSNGEKYWNDTAIVITWDDWGGWYDHEAPQLNTQLGYQLGFRVPLLFVSAYGINNANGNCIGSIDGTDVLDFGSIADFVEGNFLGTGREGMLGFADNRALNRGNPFPDLHSFYNITKPACTFQPILSQTGADYFLNDNSQVLPPDDE